MDTNTDHYNTLQKSIPYYSYKHWLVSQLKALIKTEYEALFYAVIVHGSFGTNELLKFSDFDGLLIVNDAYLDSDLLKNFKSKSMKLIYKFDPLQHHGWFQISKSDLSHYPQGYLPHEILDFSKLIYPKSSDFNVTITFNNAEVDYKIALIHIIGLLEQQILLDWKNERVYMLKSYLSKIMLLPSLYYSSKNSRGIFKKESFDQVKNDFTTEEWNAIVKATIIRGEWNHKLAYIQKKIMQNPNKIFRKATKIWIAPKIDSLLAEQLNNEIKTSLSLFLKAIKSKLL